MKAQATKTDVYTTVTDKIIAAIGAGTRPWIKPWNAQAETRVSQLPLRENGTPYRGVNILLLWCEAMSKGFMRHRWMTFKQALAHGAYVRKGEKGTMVVYANRATTTEINEEGDEVERSFAFLKSYVVFNVEQIEGLPAQFDESPEAPAQGPAPNLIKEAEEFFAQTGAKVRHGGTRAFYSPAGDFIQMPAPVLFRDAQSYTATKAHELVHWTGHESRLGREFGARFGDDAYAFEELIAELGAAFLCATLGIALEQREDHAAYLASWLKVLKQDRRAIVAAAAHAQRAAEFLDGFEERQ